MSRDALHVVDDLALDRGTGRTDGVRIVGHVVAEMFGPDGVLKARVESHNLITAVGDQLYASRGAGLTSSAVPTGMKLGTGSTAVAKTGAGAALVTYPVSYTHLDVYKRQPQGMDHQRGILH